MHEPRFRNVAPVIVIGSLIAGCNLADPLEGEGPPNSTSADTDLDAGPADGAIDMPVVDGDDDPDMPDDVNPDTPDDMNPDMSVELTIQNFFPIFFREYCTALNRLDLQFNDFYWWETVEDCTNSLELFIGAEAEFWVHDVTMGRLTFNADVGRQLIDSLSELSHPADVQDVDINTVFEAASAPYEPCATSDSCIDGRVNNRCIKAYYSDCEGTCAPSSQECGQDVCTSEEYCDAADTCVAKKPDGESCNGHEECIKRCLFDPGTGERSCGALGVGDACDENRQGCDEGLYCDTTVASPTCQPRVDDGAACTLDAACPDESVCDGTCTPLDEGTPCRNGSYCGADLRCVRINTADPDRACFGVRDAGDPCSSDSNCPDGHYCDRDQSPAVCAPDLGLGEPCDFGDSCADDLTCRRASFSDPGTCEEWVWGLGEGETCFQNAANCGWGLYCEKEGPDSLRGTCVQRTRPEVSDACLEILECVDSRCDTGNTDTCQTQSAVGEACTDPPDCQTFACDQRSGECISRDDICP